MSEKSRLRKHNEILEQKLFEAIRTKEASEELRNKTQDKYDRAANHIKQLEEQRKKLVAEIEHKDVRATAQIDEINKLKKEIIELQMLSSVLRGRLDCAEDKPNDFKDKYKRAANQIQDLIRRTENFEVIEGHNSKLRERIKSLECQRVAFKAKYDGLREEIDKLRNENVVLVETIGKLRAGLLEAKAVDGMRDAGPINIDIISAKLIQERDEARQREKQTKFERDALRNGTEKLLARIDSQVKTIEERNRNIEKLREENDALKEAKSDRELIKELIEKLTDGREWK